MFPNLFNGKGKHLVPLELDIFESRPTGKILLGDQQSIGREFLVGHGIDVIVCCSENMFRLCEQLPTQYQQQVLLIDPTSIPQLESVALRDAVAFISRALAAQQNVLIFGETGRGNAAILTAYFLMTQYSISLAQAVNLMERAWNERLVLTRLLCQLAVDFEMYKFRRNSMIVDQDSLLILPEYLEGFERPDHIRGSSFQGPRLLAAILGLFVLILALYFRGFTSRSALPTKARYVPTPAQQTSSDNATIISLPTTPVAEEASSSLLPSFVSFLPSVGLISQTPPSSSSQKEKEAAEAMWAQCRLPTSFTTDLTRQQDALRLWLKSFVELYRTSYEKYTRGIADYDLSSTETQRIQLEIARLQDEEARLAREDELLAAAAIVRQILANEEKLRKFAQDRSQLVQKRLHATVHDYHRRTQQLLGQFPARNASLQALVLASYEDLSHRMQEFDVYIAAQRDLLRTRAAQYEAALTASDEARQAAQLQLQQLLRDAEEARRILEEKIALLTIDLSDVDARLSEWSRRIDDSILGSDVSDPNKNSQQKQHQVKKGQHGIHPPGHPPLPQHQHLNHPQLVQVLQDEVDSLLRTAQLGQQVFLQEIAQHEAEYARWAALLKDLQEEERLLEKHIFEAFAHLRQWQEVLRGAEEVLLIYREPVRDLQRVVAEPCGVLSLEIVSYTATHALSTGALSTACISETLRTLQEEIVRVQTQVDPLHTQYIAARSLYLQKVEQKQRHNDTLAAYALHKESLILQRDYTGAHRIREQIAEEKRQFATIDVDIAQALLRANHVEAEWHQAEQRLTGLIEQLRGLVLEEQKSQYPVQLMPRLLELVEHQEALNSVIAGKQSEKEGENDGEEKKVKVLVQSLYESEQRHLQDLLHQLQKI